MSQAVQPVIECANCKQPLSGSYCSLCGERKLDRQSLTVRHFITHTVVDELLQVDGKIWRTLRRLFFHPSFLTMEYCAGRRKPYINPLRLLIVAILVFVVATHGRGFIASLQIGPLTLSVAPTMLPPGATLDETLHRFDRFGVLAGLIAAKQQSRGEALPEFAQRLQGMLESFVQPLAFSNVFLLAVGLYVLYRRKRPLFIEHGVFSMHQVTFALLSSMLMVPVGPLIEAGFPAIAIPMLITGFIWQVAYLVVAIRRFYFEHHLGGIGLWLKCIGVAFTVYVMNAFSITSVQLLGAAVAIWIL